MTDKQLKKLSKQELLSLLLTQSKEMDRLKEELEETRKQLEDRNIQISKCGSLAEASLAVFHVLEEAQKAADLYLDNVKSGRFEPDEVPADKAEEVRELSSGKAKEVQKHNGFTASQCSHFRQSTKTQ